jgi:hypothetical protein
MKKWLKNYVLFVLMFILGLFQAITGLLLWWVIPGGGFQGGKGQDTGSIILWDRHTWITLHNWMAVALLVLVICHVILHWKWITFMTKKSLGVKS